MQSQTKDEILILLEKCHQILLQENMKAAPDNSHFFLTRVNFFGNIKKRNTIKSIKISHRCNPKTPIILK